MPRFALPFLAFAALMSGGAASAGDEALHVVALEPVTVPIVDGPRADGSLRFTALVQTADEAAAERLGARLPTLRAAALGAGSDFGRLHASRWVAVDAARLSADLGAALKRAEPGVTGVLLLEVYAG